MNREGWGLIEVFVALGILGVVALSQGQILNYSQRGLATVRTASDVQTFVNNLHTVFSDPARCASALSQVEWTTQPEVSFTEIRIGEMTLAQVGRDLAPGAKLVSLQLTSVPGTTPIDRGEQGSEHLVHFTYAVQRSEQVLGLARVSNENHPILLRMLALNGRITGCQSTSTETNPGDGSPTDPAEVCRAFGGTWDPGDPNIPRPSSCRFNPSYDERSCSTIATSNNISADLLIGGQPTGEGLMNTYDPNRNECEVRCAQGKEARQIGTPTAEVVTGSSEAPGVLRLVASAITQGDTGPNSLKMRTTSTTPRDVEELVAWCVRQAQGGNRRACSWFSIRTTLRVACVDSPEESGTRYLGQAIPEETHTHEIVHGQYNASVNEQRERAIPRTATHLQTKVLCWYANGEGQSTDGRVLLQFLDSSQNVIQELLLCSLNFRPGGSSGGGNSGNEVGGIVPIPRDATHQRSVILAAGSRWAKQFKFSGIPLR